MDAYRVLGVAESATLAEIRTAYFRLARQHHPDRARQAPADDEDERMREINHAYELLADEDTRATYDAARAHACTRARRDERIAEEVDLDAFELLDTPTLYFRYPCRCGQSYTLTPAQLSEGVRRIPCSGCSEAVRVIVDDAGD